MQSLADSSPATVDKLLRVLPPDGGCKRMRTILRETGLCTHYVRRKLKVLIGMGLVANKHKGCYWLTDDGIARVEAGAEIGRPGRKLHEDLYVDRLWAAMRVEQNFGVGRLVQLAVQDTDHDPVAKAKRYISQLEKVGILAPLNKLQGEKRWRLLHNLGQDAPTYRRRRKMVWDWNASRPAAESVKAREIPAVPA
jgi:hypothetical protein